jgi:toxin ParE1/3/4
MSFTVRELPKAKQDKRNVFAWLNRHSPRGANAWLDAYDALLERLARNAESFSKAPESGDCALPVRQALFKTPRGRVDRVIFLIELSDVFVLRIRGPGQAPVTPEDLAK